MAITFEHALGVLPDTLHYRTQRAEVLAGNVANVDTPGFQARDLDFAQMLGQEKALLTLDNTNPRHLSLPGNPELEAAIVNKEVNQPSGNGNTVDLAAEQASFMRNRMEFETSFAFLKMQFRGLEMAIAGR